MVTLLTRSDAVELHYNLHRKNFDPFDKSQKISYDAYGVSVKFYDFQPVERRSMDRIFKELLIVKRVGSDHECEMIKYHEKGFKYERSRGRRSGGDSGGSNRKELAKQSSRCGDEMLAEKRRMEETQEAESRRTTES